MRAGWLLFPALALVGCQVVVPHGPECRAEARGQLSALALSADASLAATGTDHGTLALWDTSRLGRARPLGSFPLEGRGGVTALAFAGERVLAGEALGRVALADPASGRERATVAGSFLVFDDRPPRSVAALSVSSDARVAL